MELYKEMIYTEIGMLMFEAFNNTEFDFIEIINSKSLQALQKIKTIINDDSLSDFDCIEKIVRVFEDMGSDGGVRHNFD